MKKSFSILMTALLMLIFSVTSIQATGTNGSDGNAEVTESLEESTHSFVHFNFAVAPMQATFYGSCLSDEPSPTGRNVRCGDLFDVVCYRQGSGSTCVTAPYDFYSHIRDSNVYPQGEGALILYILNDDSIVEVLIEYDN